MSHCTTALARLVTLCKLLWEGAPPATLSLSRLALSQRVSPPLRQLPSVEQERPVAMSHLALLGSLEWE